MLADLAIIPIGQGEHTSETLAEVLKLIKESGLSYQLTPTSTCIEGSWADIVALAERCHQAARADAPHVVTLLRIEDDRNQAGKLARNVASVEEKAGETFDTSPEEAAFDEKLARTTPVVAE